MHAAVLAVFLLTTTVDPRLEVPLWLLAEVGARDKVYGYLGPSSRACPNRWG